MPDLGRGAGAPESRHLPRADARRSGWLRRGTLRGVDPSDSLRIELHHHYERVCDDGWRRRPADGEARAVADELVAVGLAEYDGEYFALQRPEYASVEFPPEALALLKGHYERWLHAEEARVGEQLLYGRSGFWQHWWNLMHEQVASPLKMDLVVPDVPGLEQENWIAQLRPGLLEQVVEAHALELRLILPPCDPDGPLGDVADLMVRQGFAVRVRSSPFLFALYGGTSAVLSSREHDGEDEGYFLSRRPAIVAPLQRVFEEHWSSAVGWESFVVGAADVLELMSLGWSDGRIADALGLSTRTVSRRVAEAMAAAGVASRFELGMRFALSRT